MFFYRLIIYHKYLFGPGAQWLRWPTSLDVTLYRVLIRYVFIEIIIELEICRIYESVLLII
jgi:hypothetical protein